MIGRQATAASGLFWQYCQCGGMVDGMASGSKEALFVRLKCCRDICLEGLSKDTKELRRADDRAQAGTANLPERTERSTVHGTFIYRTHCVIYGLVDINHVHADEFRIRRPCQHISAVM